MEKTIRAATLVALFLITLLLAPAPMWAQGQTAPQSPTNADAEMAALQTKVKTLKLQKGIEALTAQQMALEKQLQTNPPPATLDGEVEAAQSKMKILEVQKKIEALKAQQAALLNPPPPPALPAAAPPKKPDCVTAPKKKGLLSDLQDLADRQLEKAGKTMDKKTGGDGKQSDLPTTGDLATTDNGCPAGMVPSKQ